jgi:hypothetical protein
MFYLNNENIEEMFREAAEKYQITADSAYDWGRIEQTLKDEKDKAARLYNRKKRRNATFALIYLLLLPLGWVANYTWNNYFENKTPNKETINQSNIQKVESEVKTSAHTKIPENQYAQSLVTQKFIMQGKNNSYLNMGSDVNGNGNTQSDYTRTNNITLKNNDYQNFISSLEKNKQQLNFPQTGLTNTNDIVSNTTQEKLNPSFSLQEKKITIRKQQSGFYAGLVFSPDLTFIKFQQASGIGSSFGLIAGYRFNNKWSIETGVLSDRKKYFTEGDYFDKANVDYLQGKELINANGKCSMIEIPLNARYTFAEQRKGKWTATIGMSTYFVSKEFYRYAIIENGQLEQSDHTYYHSGHQITSVLNFAVGYEHNIGNNLDLRIEPYYKLPLTGMGTGRLYLSSTGLNIGITKFFR